MTGGGASPFTPLRRPLFLAFWTAYLLSAVGTQVQVVGAAWLMMAIAKDPGQVAFVATANAFPMLLFALVAGAICDLFDRRLVLLVAQIIMLAAALVLAICTWRGLTSPGLLICCTFAIGCGFALNAPAWQAIVRELVPSNEVAAAIAINSMALNGGRLGGPALGGLIVAALGSAAAFLTNCISYLFLVAALLLWRRTPEPRTALREKLLPALGAGVRYSWHAPMVRALLWRDVVFGFAGAAVIALVPMIARERLAAGPVGYGLLVAWLGMGSIAGGLVTPWLQRALGAAWLVRGSLILSTLATALVAFGWGTPWPHLGVFWVGAATTTSLSTFNTAIQLSVPNWVMGRVVALHQTFLFGGLAIGSIVWGMVLPHAGLTATIGASAALTGLLTLLSLRFDPRIESGDALASATSDVALPVPADQFDRPVTVTIDYRIPVDRVAAFGAAIAQRSAARRRDGARDWTLTQSDDDPEIWRESFRSRSWADHLRYRSRRTRADAELQQRIVALHAGPDAPLVRYAIDGGVSIAMRGPDWTPIADPAPGLTL